MIQLELCSIEAVIDTIPDSDPLFFQIRDQLASLLNQLQNGKILAEGAELQLEKIQKVREEWRRKNWI